MNSASKGDESYFWMGGRLATQLEGISHDPKDLDDGGFWAVSTTFEGEFLGARFGNVVEAPFPKSHEQWKKIEGSWNSTMDENEYKKYVSDIQEEIAQGWVYQVNACRILTTQCDSNLDSLFGNLLAKNPAPYASYLQIPGLMIASASPELFLSRDASIVRTSPIKGTKNLSLSHENFSEKDAAENVMIVDLMRNDLGQICVDGSVLVPRLLSTEIHPGLAHLVSDISGQLRSDVDWSKLCSALLPPGSVSGAPKSSAQEVISRLEAVARGPYCGALGWVEGEQALLSVAIRIFWKAKGNTLHFGAGAGITWGSDIDNEWQETQLKATHLISIAGGEFK
jgi:para-aminobenzoate synthetase component 1